MSWNGFYVFWSDSRLSLGFNSNEFDPFVLLYLYLLIHVVFGLVTHYHSLSQHIRANNGGWNGWNCSPCTNGQIAVAMVLRLLLGLPLCIMWNAGLLMLSVILLRPYKPRWHMDLAEMKMFYD